MSNWPVRVARAAIAGDAAQAGQGARARARRIGLSRAQHEIAREYGFASWPRLVHYVHASGLDGIERALVLADASTLSALLAADPAPQRCW